MKTLVFFLEERSMSYMLEGLLPRLLPTGRVCYKMFPHPGRGKLLKDLKHKISNYNTPNTQFIVVCDQDSGDCIDLKQQIVALCQEANRPETLVRIACREMESWLLADLEAVKQVLGDDLAPRELRKLHGQDLEDLEKPSEYLEALTRGRYMKNSKALLKQLGASLNLQNIRSPSFAAFVSGLSRVAVPCS